MGSITNKSQLNDFLDDVGFGVLTRLESNAMVSHDEILEKMVYNWNPSQYKNRGGSDSLKEGLKIDFASNSTTIISNKARPNMEYETKMDSSMYLEPLIRSGHANHPIGYNFYPRGATKNYAGKRNFMMRLDYEIKVSLIEQSVEEVLQNFRFKRKS